jgi:transposase
MSTKKGLSRWEAQAGQGTELMALADASGLPLAVCAANASPDEVTLVEAALAASFLREVPERLIADRAYDSDPLDAELAEKGIELIAPHRRNRKKAKTQAGRKLRRYKRRWTIGRLFAWLGNCRRLVVCYEPRRELPWLCEAGMPRNPTEVFVRWVLALHLSCRLVSELSRTIKGANLRVV